MAKYNGHKNYNCWNVNLWLNNDEGTYRLMRDCIRRAKNRDEAAREMLNYLPEKTPDGAPYTLTNVRLAMEDSDMVDATIYYLFDCDWVGAKLISGLGNKRIKVKDFNGWEHTVPAEKCARPDESICLVWELWKGRNGRGTYRIERSLYPQWRVPAKDVSGDRISHGNGTGWVIEVTGFGAGSK